MYIFGSIFASLAFEGSILHVIFRRKEDSIEDFCSVDVVPLWNVEVDDDADDVGDVVDVVNVDVVVDVDDATVGVVGCWGCCGL